MRVRYTVPASVDLDEILTNITEHLPQGASRVKYRIEAAEKLLAQFPLLGPATRLPWLRRVRVSVYPYLIFYEVTDTEVIIHAVRHTARNPSSFLVPQDWEVAYVTIGPNKNSVLRRFRRRARARRIA